MLTMKAILSFIVVICIGHSSGRLIEEGHVLKRVARQVMNADSSLVKIEALVLHQCDINNHESLEEDLQMTLADMLKCFKKKTLFVVHKDVYLRHFEYCSQDAIRKTKLCLTDKQKYLPDLLLNIAKSLISFIYDDFELLPDLRSCVKNLTEHNAQVKYHQCLMSAASSNPHESDTIPESKEDFCSVFIPAIECFPDNMEQYCDDSYSVRKFSKDYISALRKPCGLKEA